MILLAAGGTGGHLYPALAVAEVLRDLAPDLGVHFVGTPDHLESRVVPAAGWPFHAVPAAPFPRRPDGRAMTFLREFPKGLRTCFRLVERLRPAVVAGFGAYLTVPPLLAAAAQGVPVILHEANAHPGMANRLLGRWASEILVSHEDAAMAFGGRRTVTTGNPIRAAFRRAAQADGRRAARRRLELGDDEYLLVVTGGSLGARVLNDVVASSREDWLKRRDWKMVHLTGPGLFEEVRSSLPEDTRLGPWFEGEAFHSLGGRLVTAPYCEEMASLLAAADLAVGRSGATTVAELAMLGCPAVFVPLALNPDQAANAAALANVGAAAVVRQDKVAGQLSPTVAGLMDDAVARSAMGRAAARSGRPGAAEDVARRLLAWASPT